MDVKPNFRIWPARDRNDPHFSRTGWRLGIHTRVIRYEYRLLRKYGIDAQDARGVLIRGIAAGASADTTVIIDWPAALRATPGA